MSKKPPTNKPNGAAAEENAAPKRTHKRRSSEERLAELKRKENEIRLKALLDGDTDAHADLRDSFNTDRLLRRAADALDELDEHDLADQVKEVASSLWNDIVRDAKKLDGTIQLEA